MKEKIFIDCQKGTAGCCKDTFIELTLDEFERFYDKAPIGIGVKVYPHREEQYFFRYAGIYFYFSFGIIVNWNNSQCRLYFFRWEQVFYL
ncbi:MAG: hypothetical protein GXO21_04280 [Aquificae bacterium]|nr:hypothetical protein [Aquificota bacterium]